MCTDKYMYRLKLKTSEFQRDSPRKTNYCAFINVAKFKKNLEVFYLVKFAASLFSTLY